MMVYSGRKLSKNKYAFGTLISNEISGRVEALPRVDNILFSDPFLKRHADPGGVLETHHGRKRSWRTDAA
ncbi:unnamed protein product [Trifolium pratense]|uniref:Uncharacterized protein n=1 Tax=Trifolium pratense TaxID=57577 RepID=A0ACB0M1W3_TRIPR|nr:unnamed protein product [Trifolium pratense]